MSATRFRSFYENGELKTFEVKSDWPAYRKSWDAPFETPEQWVDLKLEMLMQDFCIMPTEKDIEYLRSLKTEADINIAVRGIIDRAWN